MSYVLHDCTGNAIYSPLQQTVVAMAEAAFNSINLEVHDGAHPRLGAVDDIVFHPLARGSLDEAAWLAKAVATDIGNQFNGKSHKQRLNSWNGNTLLHQSLLCYIEVVCPTSISAMLLTSSK